MIIRGECISPRVKYWVKPDIENRISEGSIKAIFKAEVKEIKPKSVIIHSRDQGAMEIENDFVLAMTGYEPNFTFLERIGIEVSEDDNCIPVHDASTMETNRPGIYLAGVICGGMETNKWFIENSRIHAIRIMEQISIGLGKMAPS
jgi:thioredoxin reductase (NADPH)